MSIAFIAKNGVYSVCYENEVFAVRISRCPVLDIFAKFSFLFLFEEYYSYNNGFNEITHPVLGVTLRPLGSSGFSILIPCKSARKSDLSFRIGISKKNLSSHSLQKIGSKSMKLMNLTYSFIRCITISDFLDGKRISNVLAEWGKISTPTKNMLHLFKHHLQFYMMQKLFLSVVVSVVVDRVKTGSACSEYIFKNPRQTNLSHDNTFTEICFVPSECSLICGLSCFDYLQLKMSLVVQYPGCILVSRIVGRYLDYLAYLVYLVYRHLSPGSFYCKMLHESDDLSNQSINSNNNKLELDVLEYSETLNHLQGLNNNCFMLFCSMYTVSASVFAKVWTTNGLLSTWRPWNWCPEQLRLQPTTSRLHSQGNWFTRARTMVCICIRSPGQVFPTLVSTVVDTREGSWLNPLLQDNGVLFTTQLSQLTERQIVKLLVYTRSASTWHIGANGISLKYQFPESYIGKMLSYAHLVLTYPVETNRTFVAISHSNVFNVSKIFNIRDIVKNIKNLNSCNGY